VREVNVDSVLLFRGDQDASTIAGRLNRGDLIRLAPGVYTTVVLRDRAVIVREQMLEIVGRLSPDAVITDRSARAGTAVDGVLYLARAGRVRDLELPGLTVRARNGTGPLPDDIPYPGGLYLASRPRGLAENCLPSRARSGARRTLDPKELGDWIDYICQNDGPERLVAYRKRAEELAPQLGVDLKQLALVNTLVGIALGTRPSDQTTSSSLASRREGHPVDQMGATIRTPRRGAPAGAPTVTAS
jgi:hypothetical protein